MGGGLGGRGGRNRCTEVRFKATASQKNPLQPPSPAREETEKIDLDSLINCF